MRSAKDAGSAAAGAGYTDVMGRSFLADASTQAQEREDEHDHNDQADELNQSIHGRLLDYLDKRDDLDKRETAEAKKRSKVVEFRFLVRCTYQYDRGPLRLSCGSGGKFHSA